MRDGGYSSYLKMKICRKTDVDDELVALDLRMTRSVLFLALLVGSEYRLVIISYRLFVHLHLGFVRLKIV